jgi:type II secretory pathway component PulK
VSALARSITHPVISWARSVLAALLPRLTLTQVRQIVEQRDRVPLRNVGDLALYAQGADIGDTSGLDTRSSYFTVRVHARYRRAGTVTEALLERQPNDWPRILWRKYE